MTERNAPAAVTDWSDAINKGIVPMTTQMIASDSRPSQSQAPQVWDKLTHCAQIGDFPCSVYPIMQVVDRRHTGGRHQVWSLLKPSTGSYTEEWLVNQSSRLGRTGTPEQWQPAGFARLVALLRLRRRSRIFNSDAS